MYDPPGSTNVNDYISLLGALSGQFLVMGDCNAHHSLWGDGLSDGRGTRLVDWILNEDRVILLNGGSPTQAGYVGQRSTAIDLSFVSAELASTLTWCTMDDRGSDHFPIFITDAAVPAPSSSYPPRWDFSKATWPLFRSLLDDSPLPAISHSSLDEVVDCFTDAVLSAARVAIPVVGGGGSSKVRCPPWWSARCSTSLKAAAAARRRAKRSGRPADLTHARYLTACSKRLVRTSRVESWRAFCSTLSSSSPPAALWRKTTWFRTGNPPCPPVPSLLVQGVRTTSAVDAAQALACQYSAAAAWPVNSPPLHFYRQAYAAPSALLLSELRDALSSMKNTAPGSDGITSRILGNLPLSWLTILLGIYNRCWSEAYMPLSWKKGVVLAFLKPGKDPSQPSSYRPITLLSVLGKLFERIIHRRLDWQLESRGVRTRWQTGFRRGSRALDNVMLLYNNARHALNSGGSCLAVFLDISDAFGSARHDSILSKLSGIGMDQHWLALLSSYLSDRVARVRVQNSLSAPYVIGRGVPQGAVLSPLLFSLLLDDLKTTLPPGVDVAMYADDIVLFLTGYSFTVLESHMQDALNAATRYLASFNFSLAPTKCEAICFTRKFKASDLITLHVCNHPLPLQHSCRYLGVVFDSRLTWRPYIDSLVTRSTQLLNCMRSLVGSRWGADRQSMTLLYTALIRSRLAYAAPVYRDACTTQLNRLDRIQNAALRLILGTPQSTSVAAMEVEAFVPPLTLFRDYCFLSYGAHCALSPASRFPSGWLGEQGFPSCCSFRGSQVLLQRSWGVSSLFDNSRASLSHAVTSPGAPPHFSVDFDWLDHPKSEYGTSTLLAQFQCHLHTCFPTSLQVFTDASVHPDAQFAGFAFVIPSRNISLRFRASSSISIGRLELCAICMAVLWLKRHRIASAVICSDSRTALQTLGNLSSLDPMVGVVHRILTLPAFSYNFVWVPSHVGVPGNEAADLAARSAVGDVTARFYAVASDAPLFRRSLRGALLQRWQSRWETWPNGRFLFSVQPTIVPSIIPSLSFPRFAERLLALARVDRLPLPAVLFRFHCRISPLCPSCAIEGDLAHYVFDCPRCVPQREALRRSCDALNISFTIPSLLNFAALPDSQRVRFLHTLVLLLQCCCF